MKFTFKPRRIKQSYYKRIIVFMMIFALALFIPLSIVFYGIARNNISNSIRFSNNVVLSQLNYSYNHFSSVMVNICMEVFLNNNVQVFLYSQDIDYNGISMYMRSLANTTMMTNPSIDSIVVYNQKQNLWVSTKNTDPPPGQDLSAFISSQQNIQKLTPILRQIVRKQGNLEISVFVFSYFMYQFSGPLRAEDGYIVVNENASWFIDNLTSIGQSGDYANSLYLINDSGILYRSGNTVPRETENILIGDFLQNRGGDTRFYLQKHQGKKYILSAIRLGVEKNYFVIIQDYNEVFKDLINLQRDCIFVVSFFILLLVLMLIPFSRRIYFPVRSFLGIISKSGTDFEMMPNIENEFEYLQNIYRNADEMNRRLLLQSESYEPVFEQYQLINLITEEDSEEAALRFRKALPGHWLAGDISGDLRIVLFQADHFKSRHYQFEETDPHLLLSAIRNIIHEILDKRYVSASFSRDQEVLGFIVNFPPVPLPPRPLPEDDELLHLIKDCRTLVKERLNVSLSVAYSGPAGNITLTGALYRQAKEYLQYRFVFGPGRILNEKTCRFNIENREMYYSYEEDEKLISAIKSKNIPLVRQTLEDIKVILLGFYYTNVTMCIMVLLNKIIPVLDHAETEEQNSPDKKSNGLYKTAANAEFMDDFFDELERHIVSVLDDAGAGGRNQTAVTIGAVIDFVNANYTNRNLSSWMIGDYLGLSNRYLMFKFKESLGISLNEYIVDLRMRKAVHLLRNSNLSVSRITAAIGLENDTYFYKLFKKIYHCTPREFSEHYRGAG
ncbi:MAG: AraC family transcriptional regulator [Treponema sp.]|jgi:AraC-like DNA-binding protein|nr:AraC family transcriptional regulator [Treponema sp.]